MGTYDPRQTYEYRRNRKIALATFGDICALCGHGGATTVDHVVSLKDWPRSPETNSLLPGFNDVDNLQPCHGSPNNRCPTCGLNCNQMRNVHEGGQPGVGPVPQPVAEEMAPSPLEWMAYATWCKENRPADDAPDGEWIEFRRRLGCGPDPCRAHGLHCGSYHSRVW